MLKQQRCCPYSTGKLKLKELPPNKPAAVLRSCYPDLLMASISLEIAVCNIHLPWTSADNVLQPHL